MITDRTTYVTYYATRNRRAPLLALWGDWPSRAGFRRVATAGVRFYRRPMTANEIEFAKRQPRLVAERFASLLELARELEYATDLGPHVRRAAFAGLRKSWTLAKDCLRDGDRKRSKHLKGK